MLRSFLTDDAKLAALVAERPPIVSFHFGLPSRDRVEAPRAAGIVLLATATNLDEGRAIAGAGIDAVVAQGHEPGGHRGVFDPDGADEQLGTVALTRLLARALDIPVIAAGGIMDEAGIAASLALGAAAAQLGTASIACPESSADEGYRAALLGPAAPIAYDAGKALHAAAKAGGEFGYGAQWAGQGAPLARSLPAA